MAFNQVIKGTILPKVALKELFEEDDSSDSSTTTIYKASKKNPDRAAKTGAITPFVKIAGQPVKGIEMMTIDETGFIPTVHLVFKDEVGEFGGDYFPKTNVIMSVYIKVGTEKLKPIRCDFLISSMKAISNPYSGATKGISREQTYIVKGELYVPGIYANLSKSYPNLNSKDALKKLCSELGLGFAENESTPTDKMTWINPNMSSLDFMKRVFERAYQNDDSFFMGFIDKYYYLNYIEVNNQLLAEEADSTFAAAPRSILKGFNENSKTDPNVATAEEIITTNYLTTELQFKGAPNYIITANLISDQGAVIKTQGFQKNIYYYDHLKSTKEPKEKFTDFYVEGLKSTDRDPNHFLVPEEESLAKHRVKKWMNIDYGNTHKEWNAARLLNAHNLKELDKIKLRVTLSNINFQVIRGAMLPVFITVQRGEQILKATDSEGKAESENGENPNRLNDQVVDRQLTGYYYVSGAKYHYDTTHPSGFYTEFFLARREWAPSKKID
jgi:hypothetical protein